MATKGKGGGGRKKPTGKALKFLFASGILGKGKSGKTKYNKKRAKTIRNLRKKGVDVRKKYRNTPSGSTRPVFGGSKAAGLRSGMGASKPDHSATRAARIAAGNKRLEQFVGRQASAYKQRLTPGGTEQFAKSNSRTFRKGERIYVDKYGDATTKPRRPAIVGKYGRTGAGDVATNARAVNRADAIQRAAARAVAVSSSQQKGRAYVNFKQGKSLDASPATRRATTAREFRAALKTTGAKSLPSTRQVKVSASRAKLAAALRGYRAQSPALAREKLQKLKTAPQYAKNLRNPFRTRKS